MNENIESYNLDFKIARFIKDEIEKFSVETSSWPAEITQTEWRMMLFEIVALFSMYLNKYSGSEKDTLIADEAMKIAFDKLKVVFPYLWN